MLLVPEREIACTWMPAERPWVMSNMLVTIWNSAIASRLNFGWPKPEPATFCVICWPSRFSWKSSSRLTPGVLPTSLAVMPLTSFDSSIQLRPWSGSSSICRRSTLPATCDEVVSTSGDSPSTVSVSLTGASFSVNGMFAFWPTRSSTFASTTVAKPDELGLQLVVAGGHVQQPVLAFDVRDRAELAAGVEIHRRHGHARKNRLRFVGDRADDGNILRARGRGAAQQQHGNEQRPD